jgi:hypothetical protein
LIVDLIQGFGSPNHLPTLDVLGVKITQDVVFDFLLPKEVANVLEPITLVGKFNPVVNEYTGYFFHNHRSRLIDKSLSSKKGRTNSGKPNDF